MKYRGICAAVATCVSLAVLLLHARFFNGSGVPSVLCLASFGATCILLSYLRLPAERPTARRAAVISFASAERTWRAPERGMEKASDGIVNAFTIDLEDYFHTEVASRAVPATHWDLMPARLPATIPRLLDLLDRYDVYSTVFVLGWVAQRHSALVKEIANRGHELGCHSNMHRAVFRLSPAEFREDTQIAKRRIEDLTGQRIRGYRAPNFSITPGTEWAFEVLGELGFEYDSSVNPVHHGFYGNARAPRFPYLTSEHGLLEIPVATRRIGGRNFPVSGGAYLRLLPNHFVMASLEHINAHEKRPFTIYMHPWEIDSYQPPMHLDWRSQIRQHAGTDTMEAKIERLLSRCRFASMAQVYAGALPATHAPAAKVVEQHPPARIPAMRLPLQA